MDSQYPSPSRMLLPSLHPNRLRTISPLLGSTSSYYTEASSAQHHLQIRPVLSTSSQLMSSRILHRHLQTTNQLRRGGTHPSPYPHLNRHPTRSPHISRERLDMGLLKATTRSHLATSCYHIGLPTFYLRRQLPTTPHHYKGCCRLDPRMQDHQAPSDLYSWFNHNNC